MKNELVEVLRALEDAEDQVSQATNRIQTILDAIEPDVDIAGLFHSVLWVSAANLNLRFDQLTEPGFQKKVTALLVRRPVFPGNLPGMHRDPWSLFAVALWVVNSTVESLGYDAGDSWSTVAKEVVSWLDDGRGHDFWAEYVEAKIL